MLSSDNVSQQAVNTYYQLIRCAVAAATAATAAAFCHHTSGLATRGGTAAGLSGCVLLSCGLVLRIRHMHHPVCAVCASAALVRLAGWLAGHFS